MNMLETSVDPLSYHIMCKLLFSSHYLYGLSFLISLSSATPSPRTHLLEDLPPSPPSVQCYPSSKAVRSSQRERAQEHAGPSGVKVAD